MSKYTLEHYKYLGGLHKRIAELEAGLKYIAAQKDVIGWAPAAHTAQSVLAQQPAKEQAIVNEPFDGWQPEIVIIKRKDGKPISNWETNNE